jgi:hypothetical protein
MTEGDQAQAVNNDQGKKPATLTPESIKEALERSLPGAHELEEKLKTVFELSGSSASLRLR